MHKKMFGCICAALLTLLLTMTSAFGFVDIVTKADDSGTGTLRNVVLTATSGDTIKFDSSLSGQTITLTSGEVLLTNNLMII